MKVGQSGKFADSGDVFHLWLNFKLFCFWCAVMGYVGGLFTFKMRRKMDQTLSEAQYRDVDRQAGFNTTLREKEEM
jgi:hypothetical protein